MDEVQREVAVHLLANALRRERIAEAGRAGEPGAPAMAGGRRRSPEREYLRGMTDLLRALYGQPFTDELSRDAQALERSGPPRAPTAD